MLTLIRKARRRLLYNELLSQGATAASAALLAVIILLILGTEILNWYWLVPIPLGAVVIAFYEVRKRLPSPYRSAQIVDYRMNLADSLSTALYFRQHADAGVSREHKPTSRRSREVAERAHYRRERRGGALIESVEGEIRIANKVRVGGVTETSTGA